MRENHAEEESLIKLVLYVSIINYLLFCVRQRFLQIEALKAIDCLLFYRNDGAKAECKTRAKVKAHYTGTAKAPLQPSNLVVIQIRGLNCVLYNIFHNVSMKKAGSQHACRSYNSTRSPSW